jgi:hypothetical protein
MLAGLVDSIARQPAAGQQRKGEVDSMAAHVVGSDEDRPLTVLVQRRRQSSQFYKFIGHNFSDTTFFGCFIVRARHFGIVSWSEHDISALIKSKGVKAFSKLKAEGHGPAE